MTTVTAGCRHYWRRRPRHTDGFRWCGGCRPLLGPPLPVPRQIADDVTHLGSVTLRCPVSGQTVVTPVRVSLADFMAALEAPDLCTTKCPSCGGMHAWNGPTARLTYLEPEDAD